MRDSKPRKNFFTIDREKYIKSNWENISKVANILNKQKLVIVSWMRNIWKMNFIKELIHETKSQNSYFYFNKSDDEQNDIIDNKDLINLLNEYIKLYRNPSIIILQNISKIEWIKYFITELYKLNYKTVLLWNNIKIWWINEVEVLSDYNITKENISDTLSYGSINEIKQIENTELKKKFLKLTVSDIFLNDIFKNFWVKNIDLYNCTLSFLAQNSIFVSLRELQKHIDSTNKISIKTTIDYVDFSIQQKILKRVYRYDIKNDKPVTSKVKYYFTDNWIRNSLSNFTLENKILQENLIFNILEYNNYDVYSGLNWIFEFSFYAKPQSCSKGSPDGRNSYSPSQEKEATIFIHISEQTKKEETKKEVNKLLKIWKEWKKYLLVESLEKLGIKKVRYESVEIVEIKEFLEKFGKK